MDGNFKEVFYNASRYQEGTAIRFCTKKIAPLWGITFDPDNGERMNDGMGESHPRPFQNNKNNLLLIYFTSLQPNPVWVLIKGEFIMGDNQDYYYDGDDDNYDNHIMQYFPHQLSFAH